MRGIADALFARLAAAENHGAVLVDRALGYLARSRNGLTEDEAVDLLSADRSVLADVRARSRYSPPMQRLPIVLWSRLHS